MVIESHTVPKLSEKIRLSDYAGGVFKTVPSRKGMKKAIDGGLVRLNGKLAHTADLLVGGERIELLENTVRQRPAIDIRLELLFEDDFLALIHKPAGIEVSGNKRWTISNALSSNLKTSAEADALKFAEPIHRLDYPTSGVLLVGKTSSAVMALNRLFEDREMEKVYHAVTIGQMEPEGTIDSPIDGKPSASTYRVLQTVVSERFGCLNLVELRPLTGRRHQLRKHLSDIGHPILGDKDYGSEGLILNGNGLYLHASSLSFVHPFTQEKLTIRSSLPKKFAKIFP